MPPNTFVIGLSVLLAGGFCVRAEPSAPQPKAPAEQEHDGDPNPGEGARESASASERLIQHILKTQDVAAARSLGREFQRETLRQWQSLAVANPTAAQNYARQVSALLKQVYPIHPPEDPSTVTHRELGYWLSSAAISPATYRLILPLAAEEGFATQAAWQERALSNVANHSITDGPTAITAFERLGFLDDAAELEIQRLPGERAWPATIAVLTRNLTHSWRRDLIAILQQRQPQTFGAALVLALEDPVRAPTSGAQPGKGEHVRLAPLPERLQTFVTQRGAEFPQLPAESAASVLVILRLEADLPDSTAMGADAAWAQLLQPLAEREKQLALAWCERFMAARSLEELHLSAPEFAIQTPMHLLALSRYAPDLAEPAFRHGLSFLEDVPAREPFLLTWLKGCAAAKPLIGPVFQILQQPEHAGILKAWLHALPLSGQVRYASKDPEYTLALFQTLPFLADAAHFRGYASAHLTLGTVLKTLAVDLRSPRLKVAREALEKHLQAPPQPTLGADFVLALLHGSSVVDMVHALQKHQAELSQLSNEAYQDIGEMLTKPASRGRRKLTLTPDEQKIFDQFQPSD